LGFSSHTQNKKTISRVECLHDTSWIVRESLAAGNPAIMPWKAGYSDAMGSMDHMILVASLGFKAWIDMVLKISE
jgi:hypothetical protein